MTDYEMEKMVKLSLRRQKKLPVSFELQFHRTDWQIELTNRQIEKTGRATRKMLRTFQQVRRRILELTEIMREQLEDSSRNRNTGEE